MPLNHVALTVGNRQRSMDFYGAHFGMAEVVHDDEHLLILGDGEGSLLALSEGIVPSSMPRTNHFGFRAPSADAVRAARQHFIEADILEYEWQDDAEFVRVQVADPDGYLVEIYWDPASTHGA